MTTHERTELDGVVAVVRAQYAVECAHTPSFHSAHEGVAYLIGELHDLWTEVQKHPETRDPMELEEEAVAVAALAIRFVVNCCRKERPC